MTSSRRLESDVHPEVLLSAAHKNPDHNPMILELPSEMYALFHYIFLQNIRNYFHYEIHISALSCSVANRSKNVSHPVQKNPGIPT